MRIFTVVLAFIIISIPAFSSDDELKVNVSAYVDTYIATDNDKIPDASFLEEDTYIRKYAINDMQKNNFSINIAQVSANICYDDLIRSVLTLHYGDMATIAFNAHNLFGIQEAYVGINVIDDLWVDAGYFLTHIGSEAVLPKDNWLTSHSMVTYVEPFYHAGVRALYDNGTLSAGLHILNSGIGYFENNDNKTLGYNLGYSAGDIFRINLAGMIGNEIPGGSVNAKTNIYNNLTLESHPSEKLGIKAQFDYATLENSYDYDQEAAAYMGIVLQGRYQLLEKIAATARFAYFDDTKGYAGISASGIGITAGAEYKPTDFSYIRIEGRMLNFDNSDESNGNQFHDADGNPTNSRMELMINFGVFLD
jgi:opacity protein-like surface antigen